jgi:hypothetical protein
MDMNWDELQHKGDADRIRAGIKNSIVRRGTEVIRNNPGWSPEDICKSWRLEDNQSFHAFRSMIFDFGLAVQGAGGTRLPYGDYAYVYSVLENMDDGVNVHKHLGINEFKMYPGPCTTGCAGLTLPVE